MTYQINDLSKEFQCPDDFVILALLDKKNKLHITMKEEIDSAIINKSNLYELIFERIEAGQFEEIEEYKCFVLTIEDLKENIIQ